MCREQHGKNTKGRDRKKQKPLEFRLEEGEHEFRQPDAIPNQDQIERCYKNDTE